MRRKIQGRQIQSSEPKLDGAEGNATIALTNYVLLLGTTLETLTNITKQKLKDLDLLEIILQRNSYAFEQVITSTLVTGV